MSNLCEPRFIYDSFACRTGKGTHAAAKRLQGFARKATLNGTRSAHFLQLDIRSFFTCINKTILKTIVRKHIVDEHMLWLADTIIDNDCTQDCDITRGGNLLKLIPPHKSLFGSEPHKGLPIGNLTSQFFANLYLNELDQFVKRELKCRFYVRYMDDLILMSERVEQLKAWMRSIDSFLKTRLDLELHPTKQIIAPVTNGVDFVGYIIRPSYTLVRRRVIGNLRAKMRAGKVDARTWASYAGHFVHAQSRHLVEALQTRLQLAPTN
jgi:retron-type reverse transcriptase